MTSVLDLKVADYNGNKTLPMDSFIKTDQESNRGVKQAIGKLFRPKIITRISNKTSSDYKYYFQKEPASSLQIKNVLKNLAFKEEFEDKYTHIVGVNEGDSGYTRPMMSLNRLSFADLIKLRYQVDYGYVADNYPKYDSGILKKHRSISFADVRKTKTPLNETMGEVNIAKVFNLNFDELFSYITGKTNLTVTMESLETRLKWLHTLRVSDLYKIYTKSAESVPGRYSTDKVLKVSTDFFGDSKEDLKSRLNINDETYGYLNMVTYEDVWWMFKQSTTPSKQPPATTKIPTLTDRRRRRRSTAKDDDNTELTYRLEDLANSIEMPFFMQDFNLRGLYNLSIFDALPKNNGANVTELKSSFEKIISENTNASQHVGASLFTVKKINTFFQNLQKKYQNVSVIDAIQGIIAESKFSIKKRYN